LGTEDRFAATLLGDTSDRNGEKQDQTNGATKNLHFPRSCLFFTMEVIKTQSPMQKYLLQALLETHPS
jgi:hypothetical protein